MEQADWLTCKKAGMSAEYYNYLIDPETLVIQNLSADLEYFKKLSGRIRFNAVTKDVKTKGKVVKTVVKTGAEQRELLKFLLTKGGFYGGPKKLLISGEYADKVPMIIASCMAQFFINMANKAAPAFINTYTKFNNENRPVLTVYDPTNKDVGHNHVTIYGLSSTSTDYKIQEVRDIISSITWPCSVVLVAGGVPNPVDFYKKKLNMEMDAVLSIADSIQI
jgi:hypothetical protein